MLEMINVGVVINGEEGKVQLIKDINLTLQDKKIYVMTGPNGGGKSCIAKAIMGIYQPTSGQILLDGLDITHRELHERARLGIGYAFQQPARFKGIKVRDLLTLAAGDNKQINLCDLLYDVGLCAQDYLDREINASFSGGEVKRIEIATILARNLKVAIFDEPEAGIDLWSFNNLIRVFESLHEKIKGSIIIISHQERILNIADKIIVLSGGEVTAVGTKDEVMPKLIESSEACSTLLDKLA